MCQVGWITKFEEDVSLPWAWTSYTMMQVLSSLIEQQINVVICSVWSSFVKVLQELSSSSKRDVCTELPKWPNVKYYMKIDVFIY